MTEEDYKHQEEFSNAYPLLRDLGFTEEDCICGDRPDLTVKFGDKIVGIEVVKYGSGLNAKAQKALQDVLDEYGREFDKKNEKRYEIDVDFLYLEFPANFQFKRNKKLIFKEINNCLFDREEAKSNQIISCVTIEYCPNREKSFVSFTDTFEYEDTDLNALLILISHKELLLEKYKKLPKNKDISEWWLYVYYPTEEHSDYHNLVLPDGFSSTYDRVYLSVPCHYKEVYRRG